MDQVTGAIADPVRREIMEMLYGTRLTAGSIAEHFAISRPAVSRHLRVLRASGLVRDELVGRQRFYLLDTEPLTALIGWLHRIRSPTTWEHDPDALGTEMNRARSQQHCADQDATREPGMAQRPHSDPPDDC
ncbi:metalloregulator ArsR/SmtB family transcription factor [Nocardia sp. NPDC049220]|uniref:metalloregulator ArsR/SmtB family transcription factor n=1 Tax=Nocardia sp. NPDC049220 TaxID=3155273 RepID=UPI0033C4E04D